ncbi:MAG: DoxX family protein [Deltaproteobacteria bacterium]|nr:DoxX family protein [Deltaproteobacteria bacterium]
MTDSPTPLWRRLVETHAPRSTALVRIIVGWVFFTEGIQKFLFPTELGVGRFTKIGIPIPEVSAPFVGVVEIVGGAMLIAGVLTRLGAIALLIDILVAIATTKIPMLVQKGFWPAMHEARLDLAMAFGLVFLILEGAGPFSLDARLSASSPRP